jgi:hypothetical protein
MDVPALQSKVLTDDVLSESSSTTHDSHLQTLLAVISFIVSLR